MTVTELIELLEGYDPDSEIVLATQPNYPLAYHIEGVAQADPRCECEDLMEDVPAIIDVHHEDCPVARGVDENPTVWLLQGDHTDRPYDVPEGLWEMQS